jgi:hypothetical protein
MRRGTVRLAVAGATALLAVAGLQTAAQAADRPVVGGLSTITIDPQFTADLQRAGITAEATAPARDEIDPDGRPTVVFPVTDGIIDDQTFRGSVVHAGGIHYTDVRSGHEITLSNVIHVTADSAITAQVDNGPRIEVYRTGPPVEPPVVVDNRFTVRGEALTLTEDGARTLNGALGTTVFSAGAPYGSATATVQLGTPPGD